MADNPLVSSADANERRIVAYGLRNPFRFTVRPGTNELWVGDVGMGDVGGDRPHRQPAGDARQELRLALLRGAQPAVRLGRARRRTSASRCTPSPAASRRRSSPTTTAARSCPARPARPAARRSPASRSPSTAAGRTRRPTTARCSSPTAPADCIWAMLRNGATLPDKTRIQTFVAGAANPVDLQVGPGGDLFYADFDGGTVKRIRYTAGNQAPTAVATASPSSGHRAADRALRRHAVDRPRPRRHALLRLGPRRRRRVRRLDRRPADRTPTPIPGTYTARLRVTRQPRRDRRPTP